MKKTKYNFNYTLEEMAVQIRSKRKKNFKSNATMQLDDLANPSRWQSQGNKNESSFNIRRSSRAPKPKKLDDDFEKDIPVDIKIKQEPLDEEELPPTVYMSETPMFDTGPVEATFPSSKQGVRRETRKSFQSYLETLGYNTDFSKISEEEAQHDAWQKSGKGQRRHTKLRTEADGKFPHPCPPPNEKSNLTDAPSNVRASSRTPKPRKRFNVLEKESNNLANQSIPDINQTGIDSKTKKQVKRKSKGKDPSPKENIQTSRHNQNTSKVLPTSTPLHKNEVNKATVMSPEMDGTPTRMSGRVRVPKRQFTLLEDETQRAKKAKLMSPEHVASFDDKKGRRRESNDDQDMPKTSHIKKEKQNKDQCEKKVDACPGKVKKIIQDINIKREVDLTKNSQSETEKKTVVKKGRERIEKIVESLLLAKQSDVGSSSDKGQLPGQKKGVKRKRDCTSNEPSKKKLNVTGKKKMTKSSEKEHIVLKLQIPHVKEKDKEKAKGEKHQHKHHHHKHKKAKEG